MLFNSYAFVLAFMPAFLLLFFVFRKASYNSPGLKWVCKWIIAAGSLLFYVPFGWKNLTVLAVSVAVNFLAARIIVDSLPGCRDEHKDSGNGRKSSLGKSVAAVAIIANVASLLFFKFSGLFFPVAISFYTFNQISLLVDIYKGETDELTLSDYLAYILFFPKLLQGPLMGYNSFKKELEIALVPSVDSPATAGVKRIKPGADQVDTVCRYGLYEGIMRGLFLFSMGLFKKVILADTFGKAVDYGFENIVSLGSLEAFLIAVFYSFQLYFDFSGYCDMASGVSMMMGFSLPVNFDSPYKAVNIVDFWKRWHITLTGFFTKYVYIPLGGNRKGAARMYMNFMIVFLLSGLWHGNGWNFILWGAMHGVLFVITRAVMRIRKKSGASDHEAAPDKGKQSKRSTVFGRIATATGVLLTFMYVTAAWVFFRAPSIADGAALLGRIFTGGRKAIATQLSASFQLDELWYVIKVTPLMKLDLVWELCLWLFLFGSAAMIFFAPGALEISRKCRIGLGTTVATAVLLVWSIVSFAGVSTFLYMNF